MTPKNANSYKKTIDVKVDSNLTEEGVEITDSRAKLIYRDFVAKRFGTGLFSTSLGIFVSLLATLLTSNFKEIQGIPSFPYIMNGVFICLCVISGLLTIVGLVLMIIGFCKYNEKAFIKALHNRKD